MERVRQLVSAVIAGGLIGMGGTVYLSQQNPVVGSCLFAIGLFTIVIFQLQLFPEKSDICQCRSRCISLNWQSHGLAI